MKSHLTSQVSPAVNKTRYQVKNVIYTNNSQNHYSKNFLFDWVRQVLQTELKGYAELASGAMYCQLLDAIFPGSVRLSNVLYKASHHIDYIRNYKILEKAFLNLGIKQSINEQKLPQGSFSEHLHFLQWFRKLYDVNDKQYYPYKAEKMRGGQAFKIGLNVKQNFPYNQVEPLYNRPKGTKPKRLNATLSQLRMMIPWDSELKEIKSKIKQAQTNNVSKEPTGINESKSVGAINNESTFINATKWRRVVEKKSINGVLRKS